MMIGELQNAGWRTVRLGEVVELFDHQRVPLNSRERQQRQGEYPYYGAQGIIDYIDDYIFEGRFILVAEDGENLNSKKLPLAMFANGKFGLTTTHTYCEENPRSQMTYFCSRV